MEEVRVFESFPKDRRVFQSFAVILKHEMGSRRNGVQKSLTFR